MSRSQIRILLEDIVSFYGSLLDEHLSSIESFQEMWDRCKIEYLHYAGSSHLVPFLHHVEEQLLAISTAYMSLPIDLAPKPVRFGLLLGYFLFATQPGGIDSGPIHTLQLRISLDVMQRLLTAVEQGDQLMGLVVSKLWEVKAICLEPAVDLKMYISEISRMHSEKRVAIPWVAAAKSTDVGVSDGADDEIFSALCDDDEGMEIYQQLTQYRQFLNASRAQ